MDLGLDFDVAAKKAKKKNEEPIPIGKAPAKSPSFQVPIPGVSRNVDAGKDPVREHRFEEILERYREKKLLRKKAIEEEKELPISPDLNVRKELKIRIMMDDNDEGVFPKARYNVPDTKFLQELKKKNARENQFCKLKEIKMAQPVEATSIEDKFSVPSPGASKEKVNVAPHKPPTSIEEEIPDAPETSKLALRKPKSGVIVNPDPETAVKEQGHDLVEMDSFDLFFHHMPRPANLINKYDSKSTLLRLKKMALLEEADKQRALAEPPHVEVQVETATPIVRDEEGGHNTVESVERMMCYRKIAKKVSAATSLNSRELPGFPHYEEEDLEKQPVITTIVQKFRRESEVERYKPPPRKIKRGTFQSHSFTDLKQNTEKEFYFGLIMGNINQDHENFGEASRGVQGVCMAAAAYCFSMIVHPLTWTDLVVDELVEIGDKLYQDSISKLHNHEFRKELKYHELSKFCVVRDKRVKFEVLEPEVLGQIRSTDPKIYNVTKGLTLFFQRHQAGIFKTYGLNIAIWKENEHFCLYDAVGRKKDFSHDLFEGKALLATFYNVSSIVTVILDHMKLENWPYSMSKICVYKIIGKDEPEEEFPASLHKEQSEYNILNESKAVLLGSFDLADLCFDFTRNKQALAMATICLVYSRITPPSAWHKRTVDKIMIIGNQLYLELVEAEHIVEMSLENIPASFTVGPYLVEILIYSKVAADILYRRNKCTLRKILDKFFCTSSMAIVIIGNYSIAIWKQRGMYYCFDPYSRNNEGLKCRNGSACVSMNSTLDMLMGTVSYNFDNRNDIFYVHALKIIRINRDAAQAHLWPKTMTMDEFQPQACKTYKMQKTNRKAVKKPVTVDVQENAVQKLMPWEFLAESFIDVGSTVESIQKDQMPPMVQKYASRIMLRSQLPPVDRPIDLDSPSLSDTQIQPERPEPVKGDEGLDLDNWELTQEEMELQEGGEAEGEDLDDLQAYGEAFVMINQCAQVREGSLDAYRNRMSAQVNTDLTFCLLPMTRQILPPTDLREKRRRKKQQQMDAEKKMLSVMETAAHPEPAVTQSVELAKQSNFVDLPDKTQLIRGTANIAEFGGEVEYMAPFTCMMAAAVAKKYDIVSWSPAIVDYTLQSGAELFKLSKVRFDQVPILQVPKVSLGKSEYGIVSEYLYDDLMKLSVLQTSLDQILFSKYECGLVVTPYYACTVFFKNHLFYLYDCFACNEVGMGAGPSNKGKACLARFRTLEQLVSRIMYNKARREIAQNFDFTRFVVSRVLVTVILPKKKKLGGGGEDEEYEDKSAASSAKGKKKTAPTNVVGYQVRGTVMTLQGSTALEGRNAASTETLKQDHFVCSCAVLTLVCYPLRKWDTYRVDYVISKGKDVHANATDLEYTEKRSLRNLLIYKYFFDVIISMVKLKQAYEFSKSLTSVMYKRDYIIVQFPNICYVVYKNLQGFHVFDPYSSKDDGSAESDGKGGAGWTMFTTFKEAKKRISSQMASPKDRFIFYTLEITSVRKAPKKVVLAQKLMEYESPKPSRPRTVPESFERPFNEKDTWLRADPVPWSRAKGETACGRTRNKRDFMWHQWDVEYPNDLYSLAGTLHQQVQQFEASVRGKQTLACLVASVAMLQVYALSEWTPAVVDSILEAGTTYFVECTSSRQNQEIGVEDLAGTIKIFPYAMKVGFAPFVDGTMFVLRANQFNLYKALRYFCDDYVKHLGIIFVSKGEESGPKRMVAFGKVRESEYFMFDCQAGGPPMFEDKYGLAYVLRCRTLRRLVHAMTLTLRGGDFFIFEVSVGNMQPISPS